MANIKIIAMDIGGTLLSDNNTISEENIRALSYVKDQGMKLALATAREYSSTKYISHLINCDYGIFSNGNHILDINNLKKIKSGLISTHAVLDIYKFCQENDLYIHLNQEFCEVSDRLEYFALKHHILNKQYPDNLKSSCYIIADLENYIKSNQNITKIVIVSTDDLSNTINLLQEILNKHGLFITEYYPNLNETILNKVINYIEIGSSNATKASGLNELISILGIPSDSVLVIGDGRNDIEMIKTFKNSVCMSNGSQEIKDLASYITKKDNNNSGVAEAILKFVKR